MKTLAKLMLAMAVTTMTAPLHAQEEGASQAEQEEFQAWTYSCVGQGEQRECSILNDRSTEDGQRLFAMEVRRQTDEAYLGILLMPFGIVLADGLQVTLDGEALGDPIGFHTCLPSGCMALWSMSDDIVQGLRNGTMLQLGFTSVSGEEITYDVSLLGFTAATNQLALGS